MPQRGRLRSTLLIGGHTTDSMTSSGLLSGRTKTQTMMRALRLVAVWREDKVMVGRLRAV